MALLGTGITVSLADVGGTWKIIGFDTDSMALTQVGNHVYGTYNTHQGPGNIDGIIYAQSVWIGARYDSGSGGCFSTTFSNDSFHLIGSWVYDNPDCDVSPDYESIWPHNYYCPCYYHSRGEGYFQGEKVVVGNTTYYSSSPQQWDIEKYREET